MTKQILLSAILTIFLSDNLLFAQIPVVKGIDPGQSTICITPQERNIVTNRIKNNVQQLITEGKLKKPIKTRGTHILFNWPLITSDGIVDSNHYAIINYVDHNPLSPGYLLDYNCGNRTYDLTGYNHTGTDITTWPFGWYYMSVNEIQIVAAAPGIIIDKQDGNYDMDCNLQSSTPANYVIIEHSDGSRSWYWHMKENSVTLKAIGDSVSLGEVLGIVGSSGNSTGPHLHFEVHDANDSLLDPFVGPCNNTTSDSWWVNQKPYNDTHVNKLIVTNNLINMPSCSLESFNDDQQVCSNGYVYFYSFLRTIIPGDTIFYKIYEPDGSLWNQGNAIVTTYYGGAYYYWYWTFNSSFPQGKWTFKIKLNGITYSQTFNLNSTAPSNPGPVNGSNTLCGSSIQTYYIAPVTGALSYKWSLPSGWTGSSTTDSIRIIPGSNSGNISVSAVNGCGTSTSSSTLSVTVNNLTPAVSIVSNPNVAICPGTLVTFTATPVNGGTSPTYQWKVNGTNIGFGTNTFTNNTLSNGDKVSCVMTSNLSCVSSLIATSNVITMQVNPNLPVSVIITANPNIAICSGTSVTFTAIPTNGVSTTFQWKLNGNNAGFGTNTFTSNTLNNGDKVSCVITSNAKCATGSPATSDTMTMSVSPKLPASVVITANPTGAVCEGTFVTFTATPTNGGAPSYQWRLNGTAISGQTNSTYSSNLLANNASISCVMTSTALCVTGSPATSNNLIMAVNPQLAASVSVTANPVGAICSGSNVKFTAAPTNGGSSPAYQWELNGVNAGINSVTYNNSTLSNGDSVRVVMTSNAICALPSPASSKSIKISVNPTLTPSVSISSNPTGSICSGSNVQFTAIPTNGGSSPTYQWKLNGVNVGTDTSTYSNSNLTNTDLVIVFLTSSFSCASPSMASSNTIKMSINPILTPSVIISANPGGSICSGTNVQFTAIPINGGASPIYQWKLNGVNAGVNSAIYSSPALSNNDSVKVVMTSNADCVNPGLAMSSSITITVIPLPDATITVDGPSVICTGDSVQLSAPPGYWAYLWSPGNEITQSIYAKHTGNYSVKATNINNCSAISNSVSLKVNPLPAPPTISQFNDTLISSPAINYQWYLDSIPINGATSRKLGNINEGNYQVEIGDTSGCKNISMVYNITNTVVFNTAHDPILNIYPNPNSGIFTIRGDFGDVSDVKVSIVDILGEKVMTIQKLVKVDKYNNDIDISNLSAGIYFLKVEANNFSIFRRIVKL